MILSLSIKDLVIIEQVSIAFQAGFSILTGETGAGKSIIFDGLLLVCGARADRGLVRSGADRAVVTAEFELTTDHPAKVLLEASGRDSSDSSLVIRRQVDVNGRSRAWVNDEPASAGLLAELGEHLIDINGQHEAHSLLEDARHRHFIDEFAENKSLAAKTFSCYAAWRDTVRQWTEELARLEDVRRKKDWIQAQVDELSDFAPEDDEFDRLRKQRQTLLSSDKIRSDIEFALNVLSGPQAVQANLTEVLGRLDRSLEHDPAIRETHETIDRALIEVSEAVSSLEAHLNRLDAPEQSLEVVEERLFRYQDLARKHQIEPEALSEWLGQNQRWLEEIEHLEARIRDGDALVSAARAQYVAQASALTKARMKAAKMLMTQVHEELPSLKLENARFDVDMRARAESDWNADGMDDVMFLVAMNPGQAASRLSQTASGGERSRLFLALKVALARKSRERCLIFDEVDSGAGGAVADAIGRHLHRLADGGQVISVTHSPQVAARADQHYLIEKMVVGKNTRTSVQELDASEREHEVARMVSGAEITKAALMTARDLIQAS